MVLPFLGSALLIAITSALWWGTLQRPWVFTCVGLLALLGIHRIVQVALEVFKLLPGTQGWFLVARDEPRFVELAQENLNVQSAMVTVIVVVVGWFTLLWLRNALARI